MSNNEDVTRIEELIQIYKRRKHEFDKTAAIMGVSVDPGVTIQRQDTETEIQKLENMKQDFLAAIVMPSITKRRDAWVQSVADGIVALSDKGLSVEDLAQNDAFVTAFLYAGQVALRSHQKEKLRALRAAVLNTAAQNTIDTDIHFIFLGYVDTLTPLHLRILRFLDNPKEVALANKAVFPDWETNPEYYNNIPGAIVTVDQSQNLGSLGKALVCMFPELQGQTKLYERIGKELYDKGLLNTGGINDDIMPPKYIFASHTSIMGTQFLAFITSPIGDDDT